MSIPDYLFDRNNRPTPIRSHGIRVTTSRGEEIGMCDHAKVHLNDDTGLAELIELHDYRRPTSPSSNLTDPRAENELIHIQAMDPETLVVTGLGAHLFVHHLLNLDAPVRDAHVASGVVPLILGTEYRKRLQTAVRAAHTTGQTS